MGARELYDCHRGKRSCTYFCGTRLFARRCRHHGCCCVDWGCARRTSSFRRNRATDLWHPQLAHFPLTVLLCHSREVRWTTKSTRRCTSASRAARASARRLPTTLASSKLFPRKRNDPSPAAALIRVWPSRGEREARIGSKVAQLRQVIYERQRGNMNSKVTDRLVR